jgi:hypothetical protein
MADRSPALPAAPPGIRVIAASVGISVTRAHRILGEHGIHGSPPTSDLGPWDFVGLYVDRLLRRAGTVRYVTRRGAS